MPERNRPQDERQVPGESQDVDALARSFRRGEPLAVRSVRKRVAKILAFRGFHIPAADREDLEQEVMAQIWQAVRKPGFDAGQRFWGFVETVTVRRSIDWLRTRKVSVAFDEAQPSPEASPLQKTLVRDQLRLAYETLARLPKPCRDLIFLHAGLDKSYREIAAISGKSEGALRIQMYRCVRQARRLLEELTASALPDSEGGNNP